MPLLTIILLIALHLSSTLFCMEIESTDNLNLKSLKAMPLEIVQHITHFAAPPQWWYPYKTYICKIWYYGFHFDVNGKVFEITSIYKAKIPKLQKKRFDCLINEVFTPLPGYFNSSKHQFITTLSNEIIVCNRIPHAQTQTPLGHTDWVHSICPDTSLKFLASESHDCKAYITHQELCSFKYKHDVTALCVNQSGKLFATVLGIRTIDIFTQYDDYTLWQLIFRQILSTWLLIKKPNKKINTVKKLLQKISLISFIPYKELITIWTTFPEYMQNAIWKTMNYRIQKYGKTTLKSLMNVF
jgi:WD40 repeat protein